MTIGENVAYFRRARHMSQQQLAARLGWADYEIDDLEYDALAVSDGNVREIAAALGVQPQALTAGENWHLRQQLERLDREHSRQAGQYHREQVTTLDAFCTWLNVLGFGLVSAAIKTGCWGWDRVRGLWGRIFGRR
jgi:transcriptional regulator with XRE-family HTH domain